MIAYFLAVVWCYDCIPQRWITTDLRIETSAKCDQWVTHDFHYTSANWEAESKDKLRYTKHKPWCLPVMGQMDYSNNEPAAAKN